MRTATELRKAASRAREWTLRRDALVHIARADGLALREIADLAQLSHTQIANILKRDNRGREFF